MGPALASAPVKYVSSVPVQVAMKDQTGGLRSLKFWWGPNITVTLILMFRERHQK